MIVRTKQERIMLREGGRHLGRILQELGKAARPGFVIKELDAMAERLIIECGGRPVFKGYKPHHAATPYPGTLCISVNNEVVHGLPTRNVALYNGDIVGLDLGMQWPAKDGLCTDAAITVGVGKIKKDVRQLLETTKRALDAGIAAAAVGSRVSDISRAVQEIVEGDGYGIVRDLTGHGVGRAIHEDPQVPNFYDPRNMDTELLNGMVIAIEPMVNAGSWRVKVLPDGWTIVTADGSLSAHFEHTVLITKEATEIITRP